MPCAEYKTRCVALEVIEAIHSQDAHCIKQLQLTSCKLCQVIKLAMGTAAYNPLLPYSSYLLGMLSASTLRT